MSAFFSVKNFEKFQHYKDRNPPWIKLYNELLDDYEFGALPDASKMHLIAIWLLASRSENKIPLDPTWVSRRINATEPVNLAILVEKGFILTDQTLPNAEHVASETQAKRLTRDRGETEGETEGELPLARSPKKIKTRIPDAFSITDQHLKFARVRGFEEEQARFMFDKFKSYHQSKGDLMLKWDSAWQTWVLNQVGFQKKDGWRGGGDRGNPIL